MGILRRTERSMMRAMCRVQLKSRRSTDLMLMFGLNEQISWLWQTVLVDMVMH